MANTDEKLQKKRITHITTFYLPTFLTYYITCYYMSWLNWGTGIGAGSLYVLLIQIAIFIEMFLITYIISKLVSESFSEKKYLSFVGIKKSAMGKSFLWANAFVTPIPLLWLIGTQIVGIGVDTMLIAAKPHWISLPVSFWSFAFAILFWSLTAIISFCFWQAFPYELSRPLSGKYVVPLIAIFWASLYNAPLLTGKLDLFDIIFFGFLFTVVYYKSRNSVGILIAYLLNENPLWWVMAATIAPVFSTDIGTVFVIFLIIRVLIGSASIAILVINSRKANS